MTTHRMDDEFFAEVSEVIETLGAYSKRHSRVLGTGLVHFLVAVRKSVLVHTVVPTATERLNKRLAKIDQSQAHELTRPHDPHF